MAETQQKKAVGSEFDIFNRLSAVAETAGGKYIPPGQHRLRTDALKLVKGHKGLSFVGEFEVLATQSPPEVPATKRLSVGESCSWVVNLTKTEYPDLALGNVKQFLGAVFPDDDIDEVFSPDKASATMAQLCSEENPIGNMANALGTKGVILLCDAWNKETRKGTDFTRIKWSPDGAPAADGGEPSAA